jgi:hypothetical protein
VLEASFEVYSQTRDWLSKSGRSMYGDVEIFSCGAVRGGEVYPQPGGWRVSIWQRLAGQFGYSTGRTYIYIAYECIEMRGGLLLCKDLKKNYTILYNTIDMTVSNVSSFPVKQGILSIHERITSTNKRYKKFHTCV